MVNVQSILEKVSQWCNTNGMTINVAKCGTFITEKILSIENQPIPVVEVYKYLGIPFDNTE